MVVPRLAVLFVVLLLTPSAWTYQEKDREILLRSDATMVLVPVQAVTPSGSPVEGLSAGDFRILENGAEQAITYFTRDEAPMSIGLLVDSSASMRDKQRKAAEAAAELLKSANTADEFFLIEFDEDARLEVPFTADTGAVYREVTHTRPWGRTSLFDAIHMALGTMRKARHERRALIVLSDGGDNRSRYSFGSLRNDVIEAEIPIYALGIFNGAGAEPDSVEEAEGPETLDLLATLTGGRHFPVETSRLPEIGAKVSELLRSRYLVGYSPADTKRDGTFRRITVELAIPREGPIRLEYRRGYYAPNF